MKTILLTLALGLSLSANAKNVDLSKSKFSWKGTKVTGKHVGEVKLKSADLKLKKDGKITGGKLVIDLNSLTVTDLSGEWATKFIGHIKSGDFFDVGKFPTASLNVKGDNGKELSGDLTIKGKTNPVKVKYTKKGKTYNGVLKFNRTKFDMKYGSGSFFKGLGDKMIHDEVTVNFKVVLK